MPVAWLTTKRTRAVLTNSAMAIESVCSTHRSVCDQYRANFVIVRMTTTIRKLMPTVTNDEIYVR